MCGICGLVAAAPTDAGDAARVRAMNGAMVHRGPDGEGEFSDGPGHVRLAMRRLSIIDLAGGWQPLYNEDKSLALVANGEVYNFVELRAMLESRGHTFRTHSDCETALHLYEDHGLDFVHHLRGMYAIALWDSRRRRLVIVRDRMGEKPLYLHERGTGDGRQIWFASEMRALLAAGVVPFELDPAGVDDYMHYQYVPEPATAVKGVRKLPAAHMLIVDVDPWRVEQRCYWRMEDAPAIDGDPPTLIRAELERISELVIRSDVPVGVALSGGLDSSAIAAMAARKYPGTMHAFSVGYTGRPRQDERAMAKELADHLKMPLHEIEVRPEEMVSFFPTLAGLRDDPIDDIAGHGYWAVSRAAREQGVPVLLQGQGGDELFWGYPWVRSAVAATAAKANGGVGAAGAVVEVLSSLLPAGLGRNQMIEWAYALGGTAHGWRPLRPDRGAPADQMVFYNSTIPYQMGAYAAPRLYTDRFARSVHGHSPAWVFTRPRPWGDAGVMITKLICETYLLENGIAQGDRLSMASSVELRLPLVDYRLVETVIGLRKAQPDHALPPKQWFRDAVRAEVPDWVLSRRKRGFTPPVTEWTCALRRAHASSLADGYLVQSGVLRPELAARLGRGQRGVSARFSPWGDAFSKAMVLEHWCRAMAGRTPTTGAHRAPAGRPAEVIG